MPVALSRFTPRRQRISGEYTFDVRGDNLPLSRMLYLTPALYLLQDYNVRDFVVRRTKDEFRKNRTLSGAAVEAAITDVSPLVPVHAPGQPHHKFTVLHIAGTGTARSSAEAVNYCWLLQGRTISNGSSRVQCQQSRSESSSCVTRRSICSQHQWHSYRRCIAQPSIAGTARQLGRRIP